jgi:hypothetical protein
MALTLVRNSFGRMMLHLICLAHDRKWRWHWAGIQRELHSSSTVSTGVKIAAEVASSENRFTEARNRWRNAHCCSRSSNLRGLVAKSSKRCGREKVKPNVVTSSYEH